MPFFLATLLIGIGLSMDAFSLSILYGTLNLKKRKILWLSAIVGIYHFIMPLLGYLIGDHVLSKFILNPEILVAIIFCVIAGQMLYSLKQEEEIKSLDGFFSLLLFGFTVSIDSFSIGMGFGTLQHTIFHILFGSLMFSLISCLFTYFGLSIGSTLSKKFGKMATFIGSIILFGMAIYYFFI